MLRSADGFSLGTRSEDGAYRSVRRTALLLGLLLLVPTESRGQSATVSGQVSAASDGQPLELVNVALRSGGEVVAGTVSNEDGLFLIARIEPGRYVLNASSIGYETFTDTLDLAPGEVHTVNVTLPVDETTLDEVVVESERLGGAARVTAGRQTIRPADVGLVPTPDVSGDLVSYLTGLPSILTTGDRGGQLFVRGGEPAQNLVMIDHIPIFQPFHLLGFYSAVPADIVRRADVYAGGFGVQYGDYLSSVIDVAARSGNSRRIAGSASVSPFVASLRLEGPLFTERASLLLTARQSLVEQAAQRVIDQQLPFVFGDAFAKLHTEPTGRSQVSITGLHTYDRGTVRETSAQSSSEEIRMRNQAAGLRYLILPRALPVIAAFHTSVSHLLTELGPQGDPTRTSEVTNVHLSLDGTFPGDVVSFEAGWSVDVLQSNNELGGFFQDLEVDVSRLNRIAFYLEPNLALGNWLFRTGLRMQYYFARDKPMLEPRVRLVWNRGMHQISGAAGMYRQEFLGLVDRRDAASVFTIWTNIPQRTQSRPEGVLAGRLPRAVHALLGYRISPTAWLDVSIEGYYKHLSDLFIGEWTPFPRFTTRLQPARGRSFGGDARVEIRRPALYALLSYGLSSTIYEAEQASLQQWYGVERMRFRPAHDRRHQINALLSGSIRDFDVSLRWTFGSGLPFSRAIGFDGFVLVDELIDAFETEKSRRVIYDRPFQGVLPTYHRLDLSIGRTFTFGRTEATIQASAINVYDRRNLYYLDVFTLERADQLPFVPSLGIEVAIE